MGYGANPSGASHLAQGEDLKCLHPQLLFRTLNTSHDEADTTRRLVRRLDLFQPHPTLGLVAALADDKSGDCITTSDGKPIVDHENIQRSRLPVDARKWAAARLAPRKYSDRIEHDVKGVSFQPSVLVQIGKVGEPMKTINGEVSEEE